MRYSLISLTVPFILLASCSLKTTKGLVQQEIEKSEVENHYFADPDSDYVYKMRMEVYGRFFGGILVVKKTGEDAHRYVLTSEFGSRLFDFSYVDGAFVTDQVVEGLDRKVILTTLQSDLRLMSRERAKVISQFSDPIGRRVCATSYEKRKAYYFYNSEMQLEEIILASSRKEKLRVDFDQRSHDKSGSISMSHFDIKMNMQLERFNNRPPNAD